MESTKFQKGNIPWNKGMKGFVHSGSFKEDHAQSNTGKTHFKKGHIPWIKGRKGMLPPSKQKGLEFTRLNTQTINKIKLKLTKIQCAYLAGFLDADGNINISRNNGKNSRTWVLSITLYNSNFEALNIMRNWIGFGKITKRDKRNKNWKPCYYLKYSSARVAKIIKRIAPFLLVKKNQSAIVMEFIETFKRDNYEGSSWQGGRRIKKEALQKRGQLKQKLQSLTGTANYLGKSINKND